ncbi:molybdenum cofactor guanylyltransferase [Aquimarina sp. 2304DJ70-9]|uniref:molybdenum cofactor guanylyltransferase n=1 Tax=Aquimarina penaris TaxID=3231044 RepID=UPI0034626A37
MNEEKNITGIILAGGKSSRMKSEKGLVLLDDKPFIQHIIEAIRPLVSQLVIVSGNSDYDVFGIKRVEDIIPESGPIAGLHSGLTYSTTENNLVVSCDVPLVTTSFLKQLLQNEKEDHDIIQFEVEGKTMPLIAVYKKRCTEKCLELLTKGERRLRMLMHELQVKTIPVSEKEQYLTTNINTIEDLKAIRDAIDH